MPNEALQKLCKWRAVLAGWHIGSRTLSAADGYASPGVPAMRDLMDKWLVMRAENSAIASLLIKKGVFTATEFTKELNVEAQLLDTEMERLFPGLRTTLDGVAIYDLDMARETMRAKGFPP